MENSTPMLHLKAEKRTDPTMCELDPDTVDEIDAEEVFEAICNIKDPEHIGTTLEQLHVVQKEHVYVNNHEGTVAILFTPTIPHCSMATLIGLCIRTMLKRALPIRFKVSVRIEPGTHVQEDAINKQLADKERVAAALEGSMLAQLVNNCLHVEWDFRHMVDWAYFAPSQPPCYKASDVCV